MKKIVVDTNIIFSCLLNSQTLIGDLMFNSDDHFEFYSCDYMRYEIRKHWQKLLKISRLSSSQLDTSYDKIMLKINFLHEELIPTKYWKNAEEIVSDIDVDDLDFVALTKYLKASLWTGDKSLYNGLKLKKFKPVYNSLELHKVLLRLQKKS